jgi:hypothetical protein
MRGECGFFVADGKMIGGFYKWRMEQNITRTGIAERFPLYEIGRQKIRLSDWWIEIPIPAIGSVTLKVVPCKLSLGAAVPVFELDASFSGAEISREKPKFLFVEITRDSAGNKDGVAR